MEGFDVVFYSLPDGTEPAKEFVAAQNVKMKAKLLRTINILADNGHELREPCSKPLGDGIFELRAKVGTDITRILYFFFVGKQVVLTNGFLKKTQKTPTSEIAKAKKYRADYISRKEGNQ